MRHSSRTFRRVNAAKALLVTGLALGVAGLGPAAVASFQPAQRHANGVTAMAPTPTTRPTVTVKPGVRTVTQTPTTKEGPPTPVAVKHTIAPPARAFASGNAQLDAVLATLPPVLFDAGAHVHFGYNPLDTCCHAGGYNPGPNDVWVSVKALRSTAELTYVVAHELGHSLHLHSPRGAALTAAVAGAPVARPGQWDVTEKVADCVAWVLYPAQTAASGITYWTCPEPWRSQVRAAL